MADDLFERAKRRIRDALDRTSEQRNRMVEDLRFSNPADPQQWSEAAKAARGNRPTMVFDQTNQYIAQVVNDARQNKPSIKPVPVDSDGDPKVAELIEGVIRHIEYISRAASAYDTAAEYSARIGLGGFRVVNKVMRPETNEQEVVIQRIHDPLSMILDPDSVEQDGSDLRWAAVDVTMPKEEFEERWPDASTTSFDESMKSWFTDKTIRVMEYFEVQEKEVPRKVYKGLTGEPVHIDADKYKELSEQTGISPEVTDEYTRTERKIIWAKLSGSEVLEQTVFPSQYIPIVPVFGYELWIEGKRYLCGMVRRMRDGAAAYNYERTAYIESVSLQPKAPYKAPVQAIAGHEDAWRNANNSNASILPYNHVDEAGNPIPPPSRETPPPIPTAFAEGGAAALRDIQASVGMYQANLGMPSNEKSGVAITARAREGDTANFHYQDNLNRAIEQLGRVIVDMIPRVYDTKRIARIMGTDGTSSFVTIDPKQQDAYHKDDQGNITINPAIGCYDVRIIAGPSYTTLRQEASQGLTAMLQASPQLTPIIGPLWARMQDWPEADKLAKALLTMAPPPVQQALSTEQGNNAIEMHPEVQRIIGEAKQHIDALMQQNQALQQAASKMAAEREKEQLISAHQGRKDSIAWYDAVTARIAAVSKMPPELLSTPLGQMAAAEMGDEIKQEGMPNQTMAPPLQTVGAPPPIQPAPPVGAIPSNQSPPSAGFSLPATTPLSGQQQ